MNTPTKTFAMLALAGALFAAGCSQSPVREGDAPDADVSPEQQVIERAQARWDAQIARDWEKAYGYYTPGFRRAVTLERFAARFGGAASWQSAEVLDAECREQRCDVRVRITAEPALSRRFGPIVTEVEERWVQDQGQWWRHERF